MHYAYEYAAEIGGLFVGHDGVYFNRYVFSVMMPNPQYSTTFTRIDLKGFKSSFVRRIAGKTRRPKAEGALWCVTPGRSDPVLIASRDGTDRHKPPLPEGIYIDSETMRVEKAEEDCYVIRNKTNLKEYRYTGKLYRLMFGEDRFIALAGFGKPILCFDYQFNLLWQHDQDRDRTPGDSVLYQDLAIFYVGAKVKDKARKDVLVQAFYVSNGDLAWEVHLPFADSRFELIEDRFYFSRGHKLIVVEAATGKILLDRREGFGNNGEHLTVTRVLPHNNQLWCFSNTGRIVVLNEDASEVLREIDLPEPTSEYTAGFSHKELNVPGVLIHENRIYCAMQYKIDGLQSALLVLDATLEGEFELHFPPRPDFTVITYPLSQGHGYRIEVEHDNEEELARLSQVQLIEMGRYYCNGEKFWKKEGEYDPEFGGEFTLVIKNQSLKTETKEYLQRFCQEVEWMLEDKGWFADKTKSYPKVKLEFCGAGDVS